MNLFNKRYKKYEVVKCECGHTCPIEFAYVDDDSNWTCSNCYIIEVIEKNRISIEKIEEIIL